MNNEYGGMKPEAFANIERNRAHEAQRNYIAQDSPKLSARPITLGSLLDNTVSAISAVSCSLDQLEGALQPLLREVAETEVNPCEPRHSAPPMVEQVMSCNERLEYLNRRVTTMMHRLSV